MLKRSHKGKLLKKKKKKSRAIWVEKSQPSGWVLHSGSPSVRASTENSRHCLCPPWPLQQQGDPILWAESPSPHRPSNLSCPVLGKQNLVSQTCGIGEVKKLAQHVLLVVFVGMRGPGGPRMAPAPTPYPPHPKFQLLLDLCNRSD